MRNFRMVAQMMKIPQMMTAMSWGVFNFQTSILNVMLGK